MIYTVGHRESYNRYFEEQENPRKAIGGSVWRTFAEAQKHCEEGYDVYGVLADWDKDTSPNVNRNTDWHDLLIHAKLLKIKK